MNISRDEVARMRQLVSDYAAKHGTVAVTPAESTNCYGCGNFCTGSCVNYCDGSGSTCWKSHYR